MKAFLPSLALLAAPAMTMTAYCAGETPGVLAGLLPADGSLKPGVAVNPVFTPECIKMQQALVVKLNALSPEKQKEFMENYDASKLIPYTPGLWESKEAYDAYKAEWKKTAITPVQEVALGLQQSGKDTWRVLSATADRQAGKAIPLTISALSYDSANNTWISNNGTLTATPYQTSDDSIYGAQTGTEWKLEKQDSLSIMSETVRVSKTTDGKFVYVCYNFAERSAISNAPIAQGAYVLRFSTSNPKANTGSYGGN